MSPSAPPTTGTAPSAVRFATGPVLATAAAVTTALLLLSTRYGPHRDELYFLSAGRRLAWGYVDQPALTPAVARLADEVASGSLLALRATSALVAGAVVVLAALIARELRGTAAAQVITAMVVATSSFVAVVGHLLSTSTLDLLFWTAIVLLALHALARDEPRWWLAAGAVAGVGLENKHLVAFLLAGLAAGVALTPAVRHHLRSPWAWAGAALALALWAPNLLWQAANGWPQLDLAADVRDEYGTVGERVGFVVLPLVLMSPLAAPLWVYGLVRLFRAPDLVRARPVAWAYAVLFVVFLLTGGKGYYLAGLLPALVAAGAVELVRRWPARRVRVAGVALSLAGLVSWPIGAPVLPQRAFVATPYSAVGEDQAETIGWPAFIDQVRAAVAESGAALVFAQNYGEAGAAELYGVGAPVASGHNSWADWGPPPEGTGPVVVVGYEDRADRLFEGCRVVGTVDNGVGLDNEEQGAEIRACTGPVGGWRAAWPALSRVSA